MDTWLQPPPPDWTIAAAGSEDSIKIGYNYRRMVTGEEQQIEPDLTEEAVQAAGDQEVPDPLDEKTMVVTSAEVMFVSDCSTTLLFTLFHSVLVQALVELNLDAVDLVDDAPTFFESTPHEGTSTAADVPEDADMPPVQGEFIAAVASCVNTCMDNV